jgi:hypothetical protein
MVQVNDNARLLRRDDEQPVFLCGECRPWPFEDACDFSFEEEMDQNGMESFLPGDRPADFLEE